jgi:prophage antirepressor-like protein
MVDGEPWFVAKDIAVALGYADTKSAVIDHCKRAKSLKALGVANRHPQENQALDPQTKLIPEPDA